VPAWSTSAGQIYAARLRNASAAGGFAALRAQPGG